MVQAPWTYEVPITGSSAENLDDYEARTADGTHVGIVIGLVERDGDRYVLVDAGRLPPLLHRRLAVRWQDVARVDHGASVVELAVDLARLDASALVLDPGLARHDADAEAVRVHELPVEIIHTVGPGATGLAEGPSKFVAFVLAALSVYSLLAIVAVWSARGLTRWEYATLGLPVLFAVGAFALAGYGLYGEPHVGRHARS